MKQLGRVAAALLVAVPMALVAVSPAHAAKTITLTGSPTSTNGSTYTLKVTVKPAKASVKISAYQLKLGSSVYLASAKTDKKGVAVLKFKAKTGSMIVEARASGYASKRKTVTVSIATSISVEWPNTQDTNICDSMFARVVLSPKKAGRTIWSQWWKASTSEWVNEYSSTTDSSGVAWVRIGSSSSAGEFKERIYAPASGSYAATSLWDTLTFGACGEPVQATLSGNASSLSGYVDDTFIFTWETAGWDPSVWVDEDAGIFFDVCDPYYHACDPSSSTMPRDYNDGLLAYVDAEEGSFSWSPDEYGDYVVRISIWDDGVMLSYTYWSAISVDSY